MFPLYHTSSKKSMLKLNFEVESEGNLGWVKDGRGSYGEFAGLARKGR